MTISLQLPETKESLSLHPTITVVGVGGAGGNAVNNMIASGLEGVNFVVANTDAQALSNALTDRAVQLGADITRGLGAGASPEVGRAAAEEAERDIAAHIQGSHMVFITAGMGGGTGTGAAPVVARVAREQGILTVGVVTKPFQFEGTHRMRLAEAGIQELQNYVDTLIVIPNQNLFRIATERTTFADAFKMADEVLHSGVRGVTDLIVKPGLVNLDFADIRTVMREMGKAMMGTGEATGERRALEASEAAISNPLLDDVSLKGARAVLINITGGLDMTLFEVDEAANRIRDEVDPDANIIFGSTFNEAMNGLMRVSVVATGIDGAALRANAQGHSSGEGKKPFNMGTTTAPRAEVPRLSKPAAATAAPAAKEAPRPVEARAAAPAPSASQAPVVAPASDQFQFASTAPAVPAMHTAPAPVAPPKTPSVAVPAQSPAGVAAKIARNVQHIFDGASARIALGAAIPAQSGSSATATSERGEPKLVGGKDRNAPREEESRMPLFGAQSQSRAHSSASDRSREESPGMRFFQRVAGVGKAIASARPEPVERPLQVSEKPRPDFAAAPKNQADEDYLDIPAFLRRQAN